jgi:hypothetical protein
VRVSNWCAHTCSAAVGNRADTQARAAAGYLEEEVSVIGVKRHDQGNARSSIRIRSGQLVQFFSLQQQRRHMSVSVNNGRSGPGSPHTQTCKPNAAEGQGLTVVTFNTPRRQYLHRPVRVVKALFTRLSLRRNIMEILEPRPIKRTKIEATAHTSNGRSDRHNGGATSRKPDSDLELPVCPRLEVHVCKARHEPDVR